MFSAVGIIGGWLVGVVMIGVDGARSGRPDARRCGSVERRGQRGHQKHGVRRGRCLCGAVPGLHGHPTPEGVSGLTTRTVVMASLLVLGGWTFAHRHDVQHLMLVVLTDLIANLYIFIKRKAMKKSKMMWVGLFVVLGAAALLFLALKSANLLHLNFQSTLRGAGQDPTTSVASNPALPSKVPVWWWWAV